MAWRAVVGLVLILMAGCSENAAPDANQDDASLGVVEGIVVDAAIHPIQGAQLTLTSGELVVGNTTSDAEGLFRFTGLIPGAYILSTAKFGYLDDLTTVTAVSSGPLVQVVLAPDPLAVKPYNQAFSYEGFMDCAATFASPCQFVTETTGVGQDSTFFSFLLDQKPTLVQAEFVWDSTSAAGEGLEFYLEVGVAESECTSEFEGGVMGASPLTMRIPGLELGADRGGGSCDFQFYTYAGDSLGQGCMPACFGTTVNQSFRVFLTAFYGYEPPEAWRLTDGSGIPPPPSAA